MNRKYYTARISIVDAYNVRLEIRDVENNLIKEPAGAFGLNPDERFKIRELHDKARDRNISGDDIKELGSLLFSALFDKDLQREFLEVSRKARDENAFLRLELDIDETRFTAEASLPWELMYCRSENLWLATVPHITLVRRRAMAQAANNITLNPGERLRIALAVASPSDLQDVQFQELYDELRDMASIERLEILEVVESATLGKIDGLLGQRPHIFHFIGHGRLKDENRRDSGQLALVDSSGKADWTAAERFCDPFQRHTPGLVIIHSCESGTLSGSQALVGIASRLVQMNVPAVVGMQFKVTIPTARMFALEFYRRLADSIPVDMAVQEARRCIALGPKGYDAPDFATPVLFMRARDGQIFKRRTDIPDKPNCPPSKYGELFGVPPLPEKFLPRKNDLNQFKKELLLRNAQASAITGTVISHAIQGMGGIGKTVLATALAHDEEVRRAFPDGIFWSTLGQKPNIEARIADICRSLGDTPDFTDTEGGRRQINNLLKDKACLLILDDVWAIKHADEFKKVLGPKCYLLITTRIESVASGIGAVNHRICTVSNEESLAYLSKWTGTRTEDIPDEAHKVCNECNGLFLALYLCGAQIAAGTSWADLLDSLQKADLHFLDNLYGEDDPQRSIMKSMQVGLDALEQINPEYLKRYLELAVFFEDVPIPENTIVTLWCYSDSNISEARLRQIITILAQRALIMFSGISPNRTITLHDMQHAFLRLKYLLTRRAKDDQLLNFKNEEIIKELHKKLVYSYEKKLDKVLSQRRQNERFPFIEKKNKAWHLLPDDGYFYKHFPEHLLTIGQTEELLEFLKDVRTFVYYSKDIYLYITHWKNLRTTVLSYQLNFDELANLFAEQLESEYLSNDTPYIYSNTARAIGLLAMELGYCEQAAFFREKALSYLPVDFDELIRSQILNEAGDSYYHSGNLDMAEQKLEEALKIMRNHYTIHPDLADTINNYANVLFSRQQFESARQLYEEVLTILNKIPGGHNYCEANALNNLAMISSNSGLKDEARLYFEKSVAILNDIEIPYWGATVIRNNFGDFLEKYSSYDEALKQYTIAYELCYKYYGYESPRTIGFMGNIVGMYAKLLQSGKNSGFIADFIDKMYEAAQRCPNFTNSIVQLCLSAEALMKNGLYRTARELLQKVSLTDDCSPDHRSLYLHDMGAALYYCGDYDKAIVNLKEAIEIRENNFTPGHEFIWRTAQFLIATLHNKGRFDEVVEISRKLYEHYVPVLSPHTRFYSDVQCCLRQTLFSVNGFELSELIHRDLIKYADNLLIRLKKNNPELADLQWNDLARIYLDLGNHQYSQNKSWPEAEKYYRDSITCVRQGMILNKEADSILKEARIGLFAALRKVGKYISFDEVKGSAYLKEKESENEILFFEEMGFTFERTEEFDQAVNFHEQAAELLKQVDIPDHKRIWYSIGGMIRSCIKLKNYDKAVKLVQGHRQSYKEYLKAGSEENYSILSEMANFLKYERWEAAIEIYREIINKGKVFFRENRGTVSPTDNRLFILSCAYNEIALYEYVPKEDWGNALSYYQDAIKIMCGLQYEIELVNMKLNLQTVKHKAPYLNADYEEVERLTRLLENANDKRAEKGRKILSEIG